MRAQDHEGASRLRVDAGHCIESCHTETLTQFCKVCISVSPILDSLPVRDSARPGGSVPECRALQLLRQHVRPQLVRARVAVVCAVLVMQVIVPQRYSLWKGVQNVQTCCLNDTGAVSLPLHQHSGLKRASGPCNCMYLNAEV